MKSKEKIKSKLDEIKPLAKFQYEKAEHDFLDSSNAVEGRAREIVAKTKKNITIDEAVEAYALFRALYEKMKELHDDAIKSLFLSCELNELSGDLVDVSKIEAISENATKGAAAKLAADPKQKDKALVRDCWDAWQGKPDRYKGNEAFARDMLKKYESLESTAVITRWCRAWCEERISSKK